jgi:hypothetical protein
VTLNLIPSFGAWTRSCLSAPVSFGGLDRSVPQEQLNLLKFAASGPA